MINWAGIYMGDFNSGYTCLTCDEIISLSVTNGNISRHDEVVEFGYVAEMTTQEKTPEMLLENLKKRK
jgi:hypothetical protein